MAEEAKCDPEIYENGTPIAHVHVHDFKAIDGWLQRAAKISDTRMDWSMFAGWAAIKCIGNTKAALIAVIHYAPEDAIIGVYWPDGEVTTFGFEDCERDPEEVIKKARQKPAKKG